MWSVHVRVGAVIAALSIASTVPLTATTVVLGPNGLVTEHGQWFVKPNPADGGYFALAVASGDFDGNGADDLATWMPGDQDRDLHWRPSLDLRYGRPEAGLEDRSHIVVLRDDGYPTGILGYYTTALASGDFNGDGFDDLAVAMPETFAEPSVQVYYGSSDGLQTESWEQIDEHAAGEPKHECGDNSFGASLAVGNFNGDSYDDLAIGAPTACERLPNFNLVRGGAVFVFEGKADGLLPFYGYRISQDSPGLYDEVEEGERFGHALAAGDFDHDSYDDLAVGVPEENGGGAVQTLMGSQWGLIFANSVFWFPGALVTEAPFGPIGHALAAGDFDGDGFADLAVGSPFADSVATDSGAVAIAHGAADPYWFDLRPERTDYLSQSVLLSEAHEGTSDLFGFALAFADFDGDGRDDLAIGHPDDDWSGADHGDVTILMGQRGPLDASSRHWLLGTGWAGVPGEPLQTQQRSGRALATGDFDGNGLADLVIGVPDYYVSAQQWRDTGAEAVLYGFFCLDGFEYGLEDRWVVAP